MEPTFVEHLWTLLKYDPTSDEWGRQLRNKVAYLNHSKKLLRYSDGLTYETDLAIITALDSVEFSAIKSLPVQWDDAIVPNDSSQYISSVFSEGERHLSVVAVAAARMGMSAAAVTAMKLIYTFRPRYLCMCGITAGVRGKVNMGDILAPSPSWDWGSGKIERINGESRFAPDTYQIQIDQDLRSRLSGYVHKEEFLAGIRAKWPARKPDHPLRLHVGPVASGAAVLADLQVVESVKEQQRKLLGIKMEAYGVMSAGEICARPRPVTFALKSVCDFGDEDKSDEYQSYAAYTSATFLYQFALRELVSERSPVG